MAIIVGSGVIQVPAPIPSTKPPVFTGTFTRAQMHQLLLQYAAYRQNEIAQHRVPRSFKDWVSAVRSRLQSGFFL
jgi:hypothetical protein